MSQGLPGSPLENVSASSARFDDVDPRTFNSAAARAVADAIRTTLGPKGLDKMLVDTAGDVIVTNDGVTILNEMEIVHPAAQLLVEVAKTQEDEVGDGTTAAVVLAGELLRAAEALIEAGLHPTTVIRGYSDASDYVRSTFDGLVFDVGSGDEELLRRVAETSLTGRWTDVDKEHLADLVVDAVRQVVSGDTIDLEKVNVKTQTGRGWRDSELFEGAAFRKSPAYDGMETEHDHARILLLEEALTAEEPDPDREVRYRFDDPDQRRRVADQEAAQVRRKVDRILDAGVEVVFCRWDIDDRAKRAFAKAGVLAVERVLKTDLRHLTDVLGAPIVWDLENLSMLDVGYGSIRRDDADGMFFVEGGSLESVTLLLRGATEHSVAEHERSVNDALNAVVGAITDGRVVAGGGAMEVELARRLRLHADSVPGREQLAVEAFADALEAIPRTLARNAGADPIDTLVALRAEHDRGGLHAGFDASTGGVVDSMAAGVVDPARAKACTLDSAVEVATMLLRIDDVLAGHTDVDADVPGDMAAGAESEDGPDAT